MPGLGMFSWFSYDLPIGERFRLIRNAGFDAVSLWWKDDDRQNQPDMARSSGLEIDNIHAPFDNPSDLWREGSGGDDYLNTLITCVSDCKLHSIPAVVIHASDFHKHIEATETGMRRILKLVDAAENAGVRLAFENLTYLNHLDLIFDRIQSERVGFCYDSGHENCNHHDIDCLARYGNRLFAVHIDDNFGDHDTHLLPFDGTVDWADKMQKLKKCRDIDYLTLEVDFSRKHKKSEVYENLSAAEFVNLAFQRAGELMAMM